VSAEEGAAKGAGSLGKKLSAFFCENSSPYKKDSEEDIRLFAR
jgi:hypothetical protein